MDKLLEKWIAEAKEELERDREWREALVKDWHALKQKVVQLEGEKQAIVDKETRVRRKLEEEARQNRELCRALQDLQIENAALQAKLDRREVFKREKEEGDPHSKILILFPQVLQVMNRRAELLPLTRQQLLNLRLTCRGWKRAVDEILPTVSPVFPGTLAHNLTPPGIVFQRHPNSKYYQFKSLATVPLFYNPFPGRYLIFHSEPLGCSPSEVGALFPPSEHQAQEYLGHFANFLRKWGKYFFYFTAVITEQEDLHQTVVDLPKWLAWLPNLKGLEISYQKPAFMEDGESEVPVKRMKLNEMVQALPPLGVLESVTLEGCPQWLFQWVLASYPGVKQLQLKQRPSKPYNWGSLDLRYLQHLRLTLSDSHFCLPTAPRCLTRLALEMSGVGVEATRDPRRQDFPLWRSIEFFGATLMHLELFFRAQYQYLLKGGPKLPHLQSLIVQTEGCGLSLGWMAGLKSLETLTLEQYEHDMDRCRCDEEEMTAENPVPFWGLGDPQESPIWTLLPQLKEIKIRNTPDKKGWEEMKAKPDSLPLILLRDAPQSATSWGGQEENVAVVEKKELCWSDDEDDEEQQDQDEDEEMDSGEDDGSGEEVDEEEEDDEEFTGSEDD